MLKQKLYKKNDWYAVSIEPINEKEAMWISYEFIGNQWIKGISTTFEFDDEIGSTWEKYSQTMLKISDEWELIEYED